MHINSNTILFGRTILLVPYGKHHVKKYHTWMENEETRELTASLPLTIDEEYEMQQTWLNDKDKCTFIVLSKEIFDQTHDEIESMIGDVNLFLNDLDDIHCGEIEIMIPQATERHKGYGIETFYTFIRYAIETLNITRFVVKIGLQNLPSINLFTKKLQFLEIEKSEVFQETTMERRVDNDFIELLHSKTPNYEIDSYENLIINKTI
ncbi:unnamed protein product [Rotaria socialis]|uniref:N-acetyltransferase domain-containing protein n=4 Tax=Rotaria socialis TaxID=392032 RepID=A0A820YLG7_9BILA|nr:unnamed protein product [Rotaria socialis]CAF3726763.1 unnamed protein product [Rotaria socialis]CAF4549522.1 unnamed protein product [Rotaria socialis]CAF4846559.1 unnamed protein product [Rotaria socialis]